MANFSYREVLCHLFVYSSVPLHAYSNILSVNQVNQKFVDAGKAMWTTLKFPDVWRPCLYMYLSFALSVNIHEGMFYWYTDSKGGPSFSQVHMILLFFSLVLTTPKCLGILCGTLLGSSAGNNQENFPPGVTTYKQ